MTDHTSRAHAVLSPSSAERWISCPASVRVTADMPDEPSPYAEEGTTAHELAEIRAAGLMGLISASEYVDRLEAFEAKYSDVYDLEEMHTHADGYAALVRDRMQRHPNSALLLERRMPTGVPSSWGTSDAVIVSPEHVEIIDFKYGRGVAVEAEGNPQLRLYGVGALETYGDLLGDVQTVYATVYQPRINHTLTEEISADDLRAWRDSLIPIAEAALGDDAPFGPSETACRWCPASGQCRAQLDQIFETDFDAEPETLTPEDLAEVLPRLPMIKSWLEDINKKALDVAYSQRQQIPGYKVVRSAGRRSVRDPQAAMAVLQGRYDPAEYSETKIKGIGVLENLLGDKLTPVLGDYIVKSEGSPSLVPESDKRQAIDSYTDAADYFD